MLTHHPLPFREVLPSASEISTESCHDGIHNHQSDGNLGCQLIDLIHNQNLLGRGHDPCNVYTGKDGLRVYSPCFGNLGDTMRIEGSLCVDVDDVSVQSPFRLRKCCHDRCREA